MKRADHHHGGRQIAATGGIVKRGRRSRNQMTVSTTLPKWAPLSIRACASAIRASGKVASITDATLRASSSGQTFSCTARATSALNDTGRMRSVEPVWVSRFTISTWAGTSARLPFCVAIWTMRPVLRRGVVVPRDVVSADHVEDHVGAASAGCLLHTGDEVFLAVVHRHVGAEREAAGAFFGTAGGDDDPGAKRLGQLDRRRTDARSPAVDQRPFAGGEVAALEEIRPDGEVRLGDCRALDEGEAARQGQGVGLVHGGELGIAAAGDECDHGIADGVSRRVGSKGRDLAGDLQAEHVGRAGWRRVVALALGDVRPVDAGSVDTDENLAVAGRGQRAALRRLAPRVRRGAER